MQLTKTDIIKYLTLIQSEFQTREIDRDAFKLRAGMWYSVLSEYSKEEVDKAVYEAITGSEFAPRIKDIVDICKRNRQPFSVSPNDLWNEVLDTIPYIKDASRDMSLGDNMAWDYGLQDYGKETYAQRGTKKLNAVFDKLRPEIKRYFGNRPERLARIAEMNAGERDFDKPRFIKIIQPFMEQQAIADKNGMGDFFELTSGTAKAIADRSGGDL